MRSKLLLRIFGLFIIFLTGHILFAQAQQEKLNPTLERGIGLYKHENYEEALPVLKQAREEEPSSTLAAYYLGLNYKQLQDYENAILHLRDSVTNTPKIKGALIELIDCLYRFDELEEANRWIIEAENEGIRPAQVAFLKGLVRIKEGNYTDAIFSFEQAKALDPSLQQPSDYQIGIAHLKSNALNEAQKAFHGAADLRPSSNLAQYAVEYVNAIAEKQDALKPWHVLFSTAWQYDDNVILFPEDTSVVDTVADQADWRTVYALQTEYIHPLKGALGIRAKYNLYYSKQNDLGFYDTMAHALSLEPSINFKNSSLSFPTAYSHTIVDDRSYLSSPSTGALYNFLVGDSQMGQAYVRYNYKDFLWTPLTADENRDGNELGTGLGWYWFFANKKGYTNLRYGYNKDWAKGINWGYAGNQLNATVLVPLNDKFNVSFAYSLYYQNFDKTNTVFGITRHDTINTGSVLAAYKLNKDTELQYQYTFVKDDSTINVYTYTRNINSVGVNFRF